MSKPTKHHRKSVQSLSTLRNPSKADLIKIINQEDISNLEACPERAHVKTLKRQAKLRENEERFMKYQKGMDDYKDKTLKSFRQSIISSPNFNKSMMKSESLSSLGE
jgi:hypothetical protein